MVESDGRCETTIVKKLPNWLYHFSLPPAVYMSFILCDLDSAWYGQSF